MIIQEGSCILLLCRTLHSNRTSHQSLVLPLALPSGLPAFIHAVCPPPRRLPLLLPQPTPPHPCQPAAFPALSGPPPPASASSSPRALDRDEKQRAMVAEAGEAAGREAGSPGPERQPLHTSFRQQRQPPHLRPEPVVAEATISHQVEQGLWPLSSTPPVQELVLLRGHLRYQHSPESWKGEQNAGTDTLPDPEAQAP